MRKKLISVIVPMSDPDVFHNLLSSITHNTLLPDRLIIINNTGKNFAINSLPPSVQTVILTQNYPVGRNVAWKIGLRHAVGSSLITILQEDVILAPNFFAKMRQASNVYPMASVYCPAIVDSLDYIKIDTGDRLAGRRMKHCDGRAFTIRGEYLQDLPAIPSALSTYFGAEWIWFWTSTVWNRAWMQIENALAIHYPDATVHAADTDALFQSESHSYELLLADL